MNIKDFNWLKFLQPYEVAIEGFIIKLESIKKQFILEGERNPIELISGRVKTPTSILDKARRLNIQFDDILDNIYDIAGIRITCKYLQDVYDIYDLLKTRKDIEIFIIKDYIKNPKPSGYRSLHLIAKYNVETLNGQMPINIEFQIRTLAMHLWASIEHSLKYKYYRNIPIALQERLKEASRITSDLDDEIAHIRENIEKIEEVESRNDSEMFDEWEINLNNLKSR